MPDTAAAEAFDDQLVPRVFGPWAECIVSRAAPGPEDSILDVACATGAAARAAARTAARVVAVDICAAMVAVGARRSRDRGDRIEWRCADALRLPFRDATFDVCFCLQGLQYFPDALAALREIRRVLRPGARLCVSVWSAIEQVPGYCAVAKALEREGVDASPIRQAFTLGDPGRVRALLDEAGYAAIMAETLERIASFPSVDDFIHMLSAGSSSGRVALAGLDPERRRRFMSSMRRRLRRFVRPSDLGLPYRAHVAEAHAPCGPSLGR